MSNLSNAVPIFGGTMTGLLTLSGDPVTALGACTKQYADAISAGLNFKDSCYCASTAALTVTYANGAAGVGATLTNAGAQAAFMVDGQSPIVSQRVLIKDQAAAAQNGIYTVTVVGSGATNWVLTRSVDYDTSAEINPGDIVPIMDGTVNSKTTWLQTASVSVIGTDSITFIEFSSAPIALPVSLANGGTNANLTASNGGIFYSTGSAGAILSGTATASQLLLSGSSTAPVWSTATYPATTTINRILYSSAANVVSGLATANSGVLTTSSAGIPVITPLTSDGQVIIGSSAGAPIAATIAAGANVTVTNGHNTITISASGGFTNVDQNTGSATLANNTRYVCDNGASLITYTLPVAAAVGDTYVIVGGSSGGWIIAQNASQFINFGSSVTTTGATGSLASSNRYDCVTLTCNTTNDGWTAYAVQGNLTVV